MHARALDANERRAFSAHVPKKFAAAVIDREGALPREIDAALLRPGDRVLVAVGAAVPADGRPSIAGPMAPAWAASSLDPMRKQTGE